jgi:hypothetical protein
MNQADIEAAAVRLMMQDTEGKHPRSFASEDKLQEYSYKYWNKKFRHCSVLHSVPNGANVIAQERNKLMGTGLLGGAADLELKWAPCRLAHIEMKNGPKKLDPNQEIFKARIEALGHEYYKATNFFEFWVVICYCLQVNPLETL